MRCCGLQANCLRAACLHAQSHPAGGVFNTEDRSLHVHMHTHLPMGLSLGVCFPSNRSSHSEFPSPWASSVRCSSFLTPTNVTEPAPVTDRQPKASTNLAREEFSFLQFSGSQSWLHLQSTSLGRALRSSVNPIPPGDSILPHLASDTQQARLSEGGDLSEKQGKGPACP